MGAGERLRVGCVHLQSCSRWRSLGGAAMGAGERLSRWVGVSVMGVLRNAHFQLSVQLQVQFTLQVQIVLPFSSMF